MMPSSEAPRPLTAAEKLIQSHLVSGEMAKGGELAIRIDQTLTQDATGTLVMLALEALELDHARTEVSVQYVDHNLLQEDHRNPDDHLFLRSACQRFGIWYSPPGNGVSHPVHMQRFGAPGKTLLGSDSHTCAAGSLGMLAIGAGGLDVALAIAGEPFFLEMPEIWGIRLEGTLPPWVSAKDVILELLRRHGVDGGLGRIIEYHGPGLVGLSAMDRHVIANMGAELGATTTVFPSDENTRRFLEGEGRADLYQPLQKDEGARFDHEDLIDLSSLEPLIAKPARPDNVVPVRELSGDELYQSYLGSSANPGFRDFAVAAEMVRGKTIAPGVSFDVNPTSRQLLTQLTRSGHLDALVQAGARIHQAGCNGCIGMGQAPATGRNSLRTVPRNFPGRSGTKEDSVFLCSPETATASALAGCIKDPRDWAREQDIACPELAEPDRGLLAPALLEAPTDSSKASTVELQKGPNISAMPSLEELPDELRVTIALVVGDDVSTDEILPAGAKVLPFRSNIPKIAEFSFNQVDPDYVQRAKRLLDAGRGHAIVGGRNYGQGSSREHAALAPRTLGLRVVLAKSFARIHFDNLVNFGVLPLVLHSEQDHEPVEVGQELVIGDLRKALADEQAAQLEATIDGRTVSVVTRLSPRQKQMLEAGGFVNWKKRRLDEHAAE